VPGILSSLPDLSATAQLTTSAESGLGSLLHALDGGLAAGAQGSPLAALGSAMDGLQGKLNIDVSGLTADLPKALDTAKNAIPPSGLAFVNTLQTSFTSASGFLGDLPLAKQVASGGSLQDAALAIVRAALDEFTSRQTLLANNLVDPAKLTQLTDALAAVERFRTDFAAHQNDFLPFLAQNLIGVAPDVLREPLAHVDATFTAFAQLDPAALATAIGTPRDALATAAQTILTALDQFDPNDPAAYAALRSALDTVQSAATALRDAVTPVYTGLQSAADALPWDQIFAHLATLFQAITIPDVPVLGDAVGALRGFLEELLLRLRAMATPQDIAARIDALAALVQSEFASSPLGQVRQAVADFLDRVRHAIDAIPTDDIRRAVEDMLNRVQTEVQSLHLDQIGARIEQALNEAEQYVTDTINTALRDQVGNAVKSLLDQLKSLPIDQIATNITNAIAQIQSAIGALEQSVQSSLDDVKKLLDDLDGISFQPVGDEVIGKINEITAKLRAINPNALSDVEKLALKGAFAVLQAIDLEGKVVSGLKTGFHAAGDELRSLLDQLAAVLDKLKAMLEAYDPQKLVGAITGLLDKIVAAANSVNARNLLAPVYAQVDHLAAGLDSLAPGALLDPLQAPYETVRSTVDSLDPAQWLQPLNGIYAEIDKLIGYVDVTPLMEELDRRQRDLLKSARDGILAAVDNLHLPDPLSGFAATLRPLVEAVTDGLFGAPDEALPNLATSVRAHVSIGTLFQPLDALFDKLLAMLNAVPAQALTDAMNAIRIGAGAGLDQVDPRRIVARLRALEGRLEDVAPGVLLSFVAALPSVRASFAVQVEGVAAARQGDVDATLARFDALIAVTASADPSALLPALQRAYDALRDSLRRRLAALDASAAEAAYGTMRAKLDRLLPDVLRGAAPLTYADVRAALETLRPSRQAAPLDDLFNHFLDELAPVQAAVDPAVMRFFRTLRDAVQLLNPLSLRDSVAAIYTAIRAKVRIIDPAALAAQLNAAIFAPVKDAVHQLDPSVLKAKLNAAFQRVVAAVTTGVRGILDMIAAAVDEQLHALQAAVTAVATSIKAAVAAAFQALHDVLQRVEQLVFVDLLAHLRKLVDNLETSFGRELDRVRAAFDTMLAAIPLNGGSPHAAAAVSA
jgi:phage-related protein